MSLPISMCVAAIISLSGADLPGTAEITLDMNGAWNVSDWTVADYYLKHIPDPEEATSKHIACVLNSLKTDTRVRFTDKPAASCSDGILVARGRASKVVRDDPVLQGCP